ncbi:MAG: ferredoxin family protein [Candidatus Omnitrophota bacterium]
MAKITIDREKCKGCFLCAEFCPKKLLQKSTGLNKKGFSFVEIKNRSDCLSCAMCALICPDCCIEVYK